MKNIIKIFLLTIITSIGLVGFLGTNNVIAMAPLYLTTSSSSVNLTSSAYTAPTGNTISSVTLTGNSEEGYDFGILEYYSGGLWVEAGRKAAVNYSQSYTLPSNITQIRTKLQTDGSIIRANTYVDATPSLLAATPAVPVAPTISSVGSATSSSLTANWNSVSNAVGYNLYRSTSSAGTYSFAGTASGAGTTSFQNTGLSSSTTYYYKVLAYNSGGAISPYSNIVSGTTTAAADTTPPTMSSISPANGATNIAITTSSIIVTFSENIQASTAYNSIGMGGVTIGTKSISGSTLTIPISGLVNYMTYYLTIPSSAVKDMAGNNYVGSGYTTNFTTAAAVTIPTPVITNLQQINTTQAQVTWNRISGITVYNVETSTNNFATVGFQSDLTRSTADATYTAIITTSGSGTLSVRIKAKSGATYGPVSNVVSISVLSVPTPTTLGITFGYWSSSSSTGYPAIYINPDKTTYTTQLDYASTAGGTTFASGQLSPNSYPGLQAFNSGTMVGSNGGTYYARARYTDGANAGAYSSWFSFVIPPRISTPTSLGITFGGWSGSGSTRYPYIYINPDKTTLYTQLNYASTSGGTTFATGQLSPGSYPGLQAFNAGALVGSSGGTYYANARYSDGTTSGAYSSWFSFVIPSPVTVPATPTGLSATAASSTTISLSWGSVSGATSYYVYTSSGVQVTSTASTSYTVTGLSASTSYSYYVKAYNSAGYSASSSTASAITQAPPVIAPTTPTGLSATAASSTTISLSWGSVSGATSYYVYTSSGVQVTSTASTSYTVTGLSASTSYSYYVKAYNSAGYSASSSTASAITQAPPVIAPATPTGLSATAVSSSTISLSWTAVTGAISYKVYTSTGTLISSPTTTSYNVTGLTVSTNYSYYVKASNSAGDSVASSTVSATTQAAAPAAQPQMTIVPTGFTFRMYIMGEISGTDTWTIPGQGTYTGKVTVTPVVGQGYTIITGAFSDPGPKYGTIGTSGVTVNILAVNPPTSSTTSQVVFQ